MVKKIDKELIVREKFLSFLNLLGTEDERHLVATMNIGRLCLSPYDHWLTEEEAEDKIISYVYFKDYLKNNDVNKKKTYRNYEKNYINFYNRILSEYEVFLYKSDQNEISYMNKLHRKSIKKILLNNIRERKLMNIIVPKLGILISGGFDLNQIIYYIDDSKIKELQDIAQEYNLNILY